LGLREIKSSWVTQPPGSTFSRDDVGRELYDWASASELSQSSEHCSDPTQQSDDGMDVSRWSEAEQLDGFESGSSFGSLAASTAKSRQPVSAGATGSFGNAEIGGEESSTKLVAELTVATRQTPCEGLAESECLACDSERIEPLVPKCSGTPVGWALGHRARVRVRDSLVESRKSVVVVSHENLPGRVCLAGPLVPMAQLP